MTSKRKGWPDWGYYLLVVLVTALTLPMYHYMYAQASDSGHPPAAATSVQPSFYDAVPSPPAVSSRGHRRLLPGELCKAGYVILKNGDTYTQGVDATGRPSRCMGDYLIDTP